MRNRNGYTEHERNREINTEKESKTETQKRAVRKKTCERENERQRYEIGIRNTRCLVIYKTHSVHA